MINIKNLGMSLVVMTALGLVGCGDKSSDDTTIPPPKKIKK